MLITKVRLMILFVAVYLLHIVEEYWGGEGFSAWSKRATGADLSIVEFWILQLIVLTLMGVGLFLYTHYPKMRWIFSALATAIILNAITHTVSTFLFQSYSPGLISGILLFLPVGSLILFHERSHTPARHVRGGIIAGFVILGLVILIARTV
jgi:hypothetical protein